MCVLGSLAYVGKSDHSGAPKAGGWNECWQFDWGACVALAAAAASLLLLAPEWAFAEAAPSDRATRTVNGAAHEAGTSDIRFEHSMNRCVCLTMESGNTFENTCSSAAGSVASAVNWDIVRDFMLSGTDR